MTIPFLSLPRTLGRLLARVFWVAVVLSCGMSAGVSAPRPSPSGPSVAIDDLARTPWRTTFATPARSGAQETLYFERDGARARVWSLDWRSGLATPFELGGVVLQEKLRFTAAVTPDGLWLIGPSVMLVRPDGAVLTLPFDADEPTAVALKDGSVLVLGDNQQNHTERLRRLVFQGGGIVVQDKGVLPSGVNDQNRRYAGRYGVAAVALADGRVLTAGGGSSQDTRRVALLDPLSGAVRPAADMPHGRAYAGLVPLPDGRVVAAGGMHLQCNEPAMRAVDVYDPRTDTWQSLPDLPVPLCTEAYHATGPSGTVMPDGTLVLGGHLDRQLLVLRSSATAPGHAAFWEVVGPTRRQRISGLLQAISDTEVVIAGGVSPISGSCCGGVPAGERVRVAPGHRPMPGVALGSNGAGTARQGHRVFVAGGTFFSTTSMAQERYSRVAEMLDLDTGEVQPLPPVPFISGRLQAAWLDADRVLVKGRVDVDGRGISSLSLFPEAGAFAVYDTRSARWGAVTVLPELNETHLLAAGGDEAYFMASNSTVHRLVLSTLKLAPLPSPSVLQLGAVARRLADGRTVLAGGDMQERLISQVDEACEAKTDDPGRDCPEAMVGWGSLFPALRFQWFTPSDGANAARWQWSASAPSPWPNAGRALQTHIDADGRVWRLALPPEQNADVPVVADAVPLLLQRSDAAGTAWQTLPLPPSLSTTDKLGRSTACDRGCRLMSAPDPHRPDREWLFLREGRLEADGSRYLVSEDEDLNEPASPAEALRVWWWDESSATWHEVLRAPAGALRKQVLEWTAPSSGPTARVRSLGWHLAIPLLWPVP